MRTLASHLAYYERWAKTWEFQALLKARPVAGDLELGPGGTSRRSRRWSGRPPSASNFVEDVQAMRRRVEEHVPADEADRELKLGPGGLRDVEFAVQLLQLVHGRVDAALRSGNTLDGAGGARRRRLRRPRRRRRARPRRTASCARWSTASSCTGCAAPTCMPDDRGRPAPARPLARAAAPTRSRELDARVAPARPRGAAAAREAVLPAAARRGRPARARRGPADPRGGAGAARRRSATPTRPARCATSRR